MSKNTMSAQQLRHRFPTFHYLDAHWTLTPTDPSVRGESADDASLDIRFHYTHDAGQTIFEHQVILDHVRPSRLHQLDPALLRALVFHLGLIESLSYWKLTASPVLAVQAGALTPAQIQIWHDWIIQGMGEYFYVNQIDFTAPDFLRIDAPMAQETIAYEVPKNHTGQRSLINLGGGKDSAAMLTMLAASSEDYAHLLVQPHSPAARRQAQISGRPTYTARRHLDPQLAAYNRAGYLNGHVPFSASLAFINLLAAVIYDYDYCLVGNETSADEPTLTWRGHPINHQFSKSTKFEQGLQKYCTQYLIKNVNYFSFLRVFNEFQIAHIFCTNPAFWPISRSCNRGQQQDRWCHACPKCLFVFLLLCCFLSPEIVSTQIFDHNLLADRNLTETLRQLIGLSTSKPLECVGTREESAAAFYLVYTKYVRSGQPLPILLEQLHDEVWQAYPHLDTIVDNLSTFWSNNHSLPGWAETIARHTYDTVLTVPAKLS